MLKPIIISYKLTTCQLIYFTNTYKPREILLTIAPGSEPQAQSVYFTLDLRATQSWLLV